MGLGDRLRRLDDRTGARDYQQSRAESFSPLYVVFVVGLYGVAAFQRDPVVAAFATFALVFLSPFIYVGLRNRRARNRSEDKWRDPW